MFPVCSLICAIFLCLFIFFFLSYCVWGLLFLSFTESWILSLKKVVFFLAFCFCPPKVGPVVCEFCIEWDICWVFVCVLYLWWARLSEVVLRLLMIVFFFFFFHLVGASCMGCYWWLGDTGSYIQVVSFVWVLTIWCSLGLVLWYSRVLESLLPFQRLFDLWSRMNIPQVICYGIKGE